MDRRMADMYDLVALVLILIICMATGVTAVVRDYHEILNYEANYRDKTASSKNDPTIKVYGKYDGRLTKPEVFLMSQIQDPGETGQDIIKYSSENGNSSYDEEIIPEYKEYFDEITSNLNNIYKDDPNESGYRWKYDYRQNQFIIRKSNK